ncbi:hypothetical protein NO1_0279 [Candidatus Termititenax aidoneus]|uniref:Uncharacterized protein n=1 Tax=Termititenax aidoneus TaxID=2218524 RepID=A0A388T8F3_TERA1|nr:hypothetical protein NO1_0279 [Candidatus Termititenax aidoneus]
MCGSPSLVGSYANNYKRSNPANYSTYPAEVFGSAGTQTSAYAKPDAQADYNANMDYMNNWITETNTRLAAEQAAEAQRRYFDEQLKITKEKQEKDEADALALRKDTILKLRKQMGIFNPSMKNPWGSRAGYYNPAYSAQF